MSKQSNNGGTFMLVSLTVFEVHAYLPSWPPPSSLAQLHQVMAGAFKLLTTDYHTLHQVWMKVRINQRCFSCRYELSDFHPCKTSTKTGSCDHNMQSVTESVSYRWFQKSTMCTIIVVSK